MEPSEPRLVRVELVATTQLSPRVRCLALAPRGAETLEWSPGQYVEVSLAGEGRRQPYSVASAPDPERPGALELAVAVGSGGGALDELPIGSLLDMFGPKGKFVRPDDADVPEVFIGTGTGVAPLRALIQSALAKNGRAPLALLFGARTEAEILWRAAFEGLAEREPRFHYVPTVTRPTNGWTGRRGRVQAHLAEVVERHRDARYYICGVTEMVAECVEMLSNVHGVPAERVLTEQH